MLRKTVVTSFNRQLRLYSTNHEAKKWEIVHKRWRKYTLPRPDEDSLRYKLSPSLKTVRMLNRMDVGSAPRLDLYFKEKDLEEDEAMVEIMKDERAHKGHVVSTAHFLVYNGASVRFTGYAGWIRGYDRTIDFIPKTTDPGNQLEAVDISHLPIDYNTLRTVRNLDTVTSLNATKCPNLDDWCLDHITGNFLNLEMLDLSECTSITAKGLGTVHRLRCLRSLKLNGVETDGEMELVCLLLEEHNEGLTVEGVKYSVDEPNQ